MQAWKHKLDTADSYYETVKGGFSFSRNGATFTEVKKKDGGARYILAELVDGKGGTSYDLMSIKSWEIIRTNGDAIVGMCKAHSEGLKTRAEANTKAIAEQVKTLKGVGLVPVAIVSALVAQGCDRAEVEVAVKATFPELNKS